MNINDIMITDLSYCTRNTTLDQVAMQMWERNCGAIPVVDEENKAIGIITDRDIAMSCALNHKAPWELDANTIMGDRTLFTCSANDNIETALDIMQEHKVRRLPVTSGDGFLIGIISIDDIVNCSEESKSAAMPYERAMKTLKAVVVRH